VVSVQLAHRLQEAVLLIIHRSWIRAPPAPPAVISFIRCRSRTVSWTDVGGNVYSAAMPSTLPVTQSNCRAALGVPRPGSVHPGEQPRVHAGVRQGFFMLRLYFLCANPTLARNSAVALTLRAVGGLTTRQIATACLVTEATMARRISRPSGGSRGCHSTSPAISGRCCACSTSSSMRGTAGNVDLAAEAIRLTRTAPCGATAGQSTLPELLCTSGQLREFRVHGFLMRSGRRRFRRAWRRRSLCLVGDWPAGGVAGPGRCHRHAPPIRWAGV
jgi:hypothetical protein